MVVSSLYLSSLSASNFQPFIELPEDDKDSDRNAPKIFEAYFWSVTAPRFFQRIVKNSTILVVINDFTAQRKTVFIVHNFDDIQSGAGSTKLRICKTLFTILVRSVESALLRFSSETSS